ncbi:MAG: DsrE family protein [Pseudomonadota bacterium]|nr:DsrE family protein [Pseudomonadota bacterium]
MLIQFKKYLLVIAIVFANLINPVYAGDKDPLFINLSSSEAHRSKMAIGLGKNNMERGHPLTIFINDQAVLIASKKLTSKYADHQQMIQQIHQQGGRVYICKMCMDQYGMKVEDLVEGVEPSNSMKTSEALFLDNTKTLSW